MKYAYTKQQGNAKPAAAKASKPVARITFLDRDTDIANEG